MPKRQDSADSSSIESEYENIVYNINGTPHFKRRKLYKVRQSRTMPQWMIELENAEKEEDQKSKLNSKIESKMKKIMTQMKFIKEKCRIVEFVSIFEF